MYLKGILDQMTLDGFNSPFGFPIDKNNRWVKLSERIPWDLLEDEYEALFLKDYQHNTGNVAIPFRVALGSLIIRRVMHLSDRSLVKVIQESPYLQYFIGLPKYSPDPPFDPSMMVHFRKRIDLDAMKEINETIIEFEKKTSTKGDKGSETPCVHRKDRTPDCPPEDRGTVESVSPDPEERGSTPCDGRKACPGGGTGNRGTLIIDASCCPVNIRYPQDFSLLNQAREILDHILDRICGQTGLEKPRTYRRVARKRYLDLAKTKKKRSREIRSVIKFMLSCVRRNLGYVDTLSCQGEKLLPREAVLVETIQELYEQQKYMYVNKVNRVENRIVSLHMPFIRPIVRGKTPNPTEFGPKMDVSVDADGHSRIECFSYDAYNESGNLVDAVNAYRERNGVYPEAVLVDAIYRNRENIAFCKQHNIRISGPRLGKPPKDEEKNRAAKNQEHQDMVNRNEVERRFSRIKRSFGLDRIMEKTKETVGSSAGLGILLDNLIPVGF